jgi:AcrR family transcriptional regulator
MPRRVLSRTESKAITRRRLLDAATRLLGEVGHGGLSTSAVARAAGVAQPTFYVHFRDMDDLLRTLGSEEMGALRARLRTAREGLLAGRGVEAVRETFRIPLEAWIANPGLFRMYAQEINHPASPMGKMARELRAEVHKDLVEDLTRLGLPAAKAADRERLHMMAEAMIAQTEALARGYLDGTYENVDTLIDVLTRFAVGVLTLEGGLPSA